MKYVTYDNVVMAIVRHCGHTFKGIAKCDPRDTFDIELGKKIARIRCLVKINKWDAAREKHYIDCLNRELTVMNKEYDKKQTKIAELKDELNSILAEA